MNRILQRHARLSSGKVIVFYRINKNKTAFMARFADMQSAADDADSGFLGSRVRDFWTVDELECLRRENAKLQAGIAELEALQESLQEIKRILVQYDLISTVSDMYHDRDNYDEKTRQDAMVDGWLLESFRQQIQEVEPQK